MPKLRHFDNQGTARFVTFNCYRNLPGLGSVIQPGPPRFGGQAG